MVAPKVKELKKVRSLTVQMLTQLRELRYGNLKSLERSSRWDKIRRKRKARLSRTMEQAKNK
jgi:hypothetical protein